MHELLKYVEHTLYLLCRKDEARIKPVIQLSLFFIVIQFDGPQFDNLHITGNGHGMEHYGNCKYIKVCFSVVEWWSAAMFCLFNQMILVDQSWLNMQNVVADYHSGCSGAVNIH